MPTNKISSTFLLVGASALSFAVFGIGLTSVSATTSIPSLYEPTSASRLQTLPHEWSVKVWEGLGQVQVVQEDHRKVLRLEADQGCISLFRSLTMNLQANPLVSWEWSVLTLPTGAASGQSKRDDHGAALYLVFSSREAPSRKVTLGYVWDNARPVGTVLTRPKDPSVRYLVVRSGPDQLGTWLTEERNVLADYRRIFGEEPSMLDGMSLVVDSDQTSSKAASLFGPITFHSEAQLDKESQDQGGEPSQTSSKNKLLGAFLMYLGLKHPHGTN
ncbi:MAG: DUF3047 domain-containing protein [Nitrospirota bacterium]|nr:DUF3047 domain-containing protein [Nitrospirota bacterium]